MNTSEKCSICQSSDITIFNTNELLVTTNKPIKYFECNSCGLIGLYDKIDDFSAYYSSSYYSMSNEGDKTIIQKYKDFIVDKIYLYLSLKNKHNLLGKVIYYIFKNKFIHSYFNIFNYIRPILGNISFQTKILDYGCGTGNSFVNILQRLGFNETYGLDPFIQNNTSTIFNNLSSIEGKKFDIITLFHSLEHIENPLTILHMLQEYLNDNGIIIVELPIRSKYLWKLYTLDYYPLDPPRHVYLYSLESLFILFSKLNLDIKGFIGKSPAKYIVESNAKAKKEVIQKKDINSTITYINTINNSENYCFILQKKTVTTK